MNRAADAPNEWVLFFSIIPVSNRCRNLASQPSPYSRRQECGTNIHDDEGNAVMDQNDRIEATDDEILACSVSDEVLEVVGGRDRAAISLISTADRCIVC
jgi:hypothetical protein